MDFSGQSDVVFYLPELRLHTDTASDQFLRLRVAAQHRSDRGSVTIEDLETLRTQDIIAAVTDACAEKHVPLQL